MKTRFFLKQIGDRICVSNSVKLDFVDPRITIPKPKGKSTHTLVKGYVGNPCWTLLVKIDDDKVGNNYQYPKPKDFEIPHNLRGDNLTPAQIHQLFMRAILMLHQFDGGFDSLKWAKSISSEERKGLKQIGQIYNQVR